MYFWLCSVHLQNNPKLEGEGLTDASDIMVQVWDLGHKTSALPLPACTATGISLNLTVLQLCIYEHMVKMPLLLPRLIHIVFKSPQTGSTHRGKQFDISADKLHQRAYITRAQLWQILSTLFSTKPVSCSQQLPQPFKGTLPSPPNATSMLFA